MSSKWILGAASIGVALWSATAALATNYITIIAPGADDTYPETIVGGRAVVGATYASPSTYAGFGYNNGAFTTISVPGASYTGVSGSAHAGTAFGYYETSTATPGDTTYLGFTEAGGVYSTINPPGSVESYVAGVNSSGVVAGGYTDTAGPVATFFFIGSGYEESGGVYTPVNPPGSVFTDVTGITNSGAVFGFYQTGSRSNNFQGFIDNGGVFTTIDPPGSELLGSLYVNASGEAAGDYYNGTTYVGFTEVGGVYTTLTPKNAFQTLVTGINDAGDVYGEINFSGFVLIDGKYHLYNVPGEGPTYITDVANNGWEVTGWATGGAVTQEGFLALPEPAAWTMMLIGFGAIGASLRRKRPQLA